jgi:hypothetical protein
MSDDEKAKPVDDLKQGLGLLFRAAKGAVERLPTSKIEGVVKDGAKEVGKAFDSVASEIDKVIAKATGSSAPAARGTPPPPAPPPEQPYDDAYAPEPDAKKGPRV